MNNLQGRIGHLEQQTRRSILAHEGERLANWLGSLDPSERMTFAQAASKHEQPETRTPEEQNAWEKFEAGPGHHAVLTMATVARDHLGEMLAIIRSVGSDHANG